MRHRKHDDLGFGLPPEDARGDIAAAAVPPPAPTELPSDIDEPDVIHTEDEAFIGFCERLLRSPSIVELPGAADPDTRASGGTPATDPASDAYDAASRERMIRSAHTRMLWSRIGRPVDVTFLRDQRQRWLRVVALPLDHRIALSAVDVSELREAVKAARQERRDALTLIGDLRLQSITDPLTGILNRRGLDAALSRCLAASERYGHSLALIAIDIDHFKTINSCHGHEAGDAALVALANVLRQEVRADLDVVARRGGEEFVIALPETGLEGARIVAERIRARIAAEPISHRGSELRLTASFGVCASRPALSALDLLDLADWALRRAKTEGRNRVVVARGSALQTVPQVDRAAAEPDRLPHKT